MKYLSTKPLMLSSAIMTGLLLTACGQASPVTETTETTPAPDVTTVASNDVTPPETPAYNSSTATEDYEETARQADSHVHGAANLALALDGQTLTMELDAPLYSFVGFEHDPETDAQKETLARAETLLSSPGNLFSFNPEAGCEASDSPPVKLIADLEEGHDHDDHAHDHDDEHSHDHDDDNSHSAGHDHDDEHHHDGEDAHDHSENVHRDALINFEFNCQSPDRVEWVETTLFETFEPLTEIDLVYLGPEQQMGAELKPGSGRITLVN